MPDDLVCGLGPLTFAAVCVLYIRLVVVVAVVVVAVDVVAVDVVVVVVVVGQ